MLGRRGHVSRQVKTDCQILECGHVEPDGIADCQGTGGMVMVGDPLNVSTRLSNA